MQGVGFRPFVYGLAVRHGVSGYVLNNAQGVFVEAEAGPAAIEEFERGLRDDYPEIAYVDRFESYDVDPAGDAGFEIRFSDGGGERIVLPMADISVCDHCLGELDDPENRRSGYPFISCTFCGPRFTVTDDIPYDRERTTMSDFTMCPDCEREYRDPGDRRFHSQLNACETCGPRVCLLDAGGGGIAEGYRAVEEAAALLRQGRIVAIKGLGGYHLACDAGNPEAVSCLRKKKSRGEKPLAVMAADIESVREICNASEDEADLLTGVRKPIVLLGIKKKNGMISAVAPGCNVLGVMLPYTPVHHILMKDATSYLVMTSGNMSDEPIVYRDGDALSELSGTADYFLVNNRRIRTRCDDSVVRIWNGDVLIIRRSRGYSPEPVRIKCGFEKRILSCGAELKNTFCMTRGDYVFTSHHIGDLETVEAMSSFEEGIAHFKEMLHWEPDAVAYDMHPEYLSTKYAKELPAGIEKVAVQHHHAHIVSCLADAGEDGPVIGVSFDGLGYGLDGMLWGGELLVAEPGGFWRAASLKPVPLPGGAVAIRQPWRMAAVYLREAFGENIFDAGIPFMEQIGGPDWEIVRHMIERGVNCPLTTSMGRLFDAVSSLVLLRNEVSYEGQAAVELESKAAPGLWTGRFYEYEVAAVDDVQKYGEMGSGLEIPDTSLMVDTAPLIRGVVADIREDCPAAEISSKFHATIADMIGCLCESAGADTGLKKVALSGGVFQNIRLLDESARRLAESGFRVITHKRVPPNDGGLALGQAVIAGAVLKTNYGE